MKTTAASLTILAFVASSALAQQTSRLLHFTSTSSGQNFHEIATVIHSITDIPRINVDATEKSLALQGTAGQVALAEWLFTNLDKPTNVPQSGAKHEYRVSDTADDVVRLFYLTNPDVPRGIQEIATAVRSLANIRQMFTYADLRAVAMRGTSEEARVADFLFAEMDKPAVVQAPSQKLQSSASPEFRMNEPALNMVRVFYNPNTKTVQDFQEVVTLVRTIAQLRYAFAYNAPRAVGVRGTGEQIALAKWLFEDLDGAASPDSSAHEYQLSSSSDDFVRVFYLTHAATSQRLGETMLQIQSKTHNVWMCIYNAANAIAVRGTADQIAQADKLIQDQVK